MLEIGVVHSVRRKEMMRSLLPPMARVSFQAACLWLRRDAVPGRSARRQVSRGGVGVAGHGLEAGRAAKA